MVVLENGELRRRARGREEPVGGGGAEDVLVKAELLEPFQRRPRRLGDLPRVLGGLHAALAKAPLRAEEGDLVEVLEDLVHVEVGPNSRTEEGRRRGCRGDFGRTVIAGGKGVAVLAERATCMCLAHGVPMIGRLRCSLLSHSGCS